MTCSKFCGSGYGVKICRITNKVHGCSSKVTVSLTPLNIGPSYLNYYKVNIKNNLIGNVCLVSRFNWSETTVPLYAYNDGIVYLIDLFYVENLQQYYVSIRMNGNSLDYQFDYYAQVPLCGGSVLGADVPLLVKRVDKLDNF